MLISLESLLAIIGAFVLKKKVSFAVTVVKSSPEYMEMKGSLTLSLIIDIAYVLIFSVGWYIYLQRSRRVKEFILGGRNIESV